MNAIQLRYTDFNQDGGYPKSIVFAIRHVVIFLCEQF